MKHSSFASLVNITDTLMSVFLYLLGVMLRVSQLRALHSLFLVFTRLKTFFQGNTCILHQLGLQLIIIFILNLYMLIFACFIEQMFDITLLNTHFT